jgi:hypothetical protein
MPIIRATDQQLTLACARCGAETTVARDSIKAGDYNEVLAQPEPDICRLPACATCGAVEFLVRTWDQHPEPESQTARHKSLVNRVFKDLVGAGKVDEHCAALYQAETTEPPDLMPATPAGEGETPVTIEIGRLLGIAQAQPGPPPIDSPE